MDKNSIDLTNFLSNELCQALVTAGSKAKAAKNSSIDEDHILWAIVNFDPKTQEVLNNIAQLNLLLEQINQQLEKKPTWTKSPEIIDLSKEVKLALMSSILESILLKENQISPLAFFLSLSKLELSGVSYSSLIKALNIIGGVDIKEAETGETPQEVEDVTNSPNLDKYIEVQKYTEQIIRALFKETKKNILLVGNDGIGKESTRFLLAKLALDKQSVLAESKIYSLDANKLTMLNTTEILTKLKDHTSNEGRSILYIDNLDISSNEAYKQNSIINILFESILSSNLCGIIPLNFTQYQNFLKSYQSLANNCEIIFMEETDVDTARKMIFAKYSQSMDVKVSEDTIKETIVLVKRYVHEKFLPESAISFIEDAISQARIDKKSEIDIGDIKSILSQKTGIPVTDISSQEAQNLQNLETELKASVIGQDEAVAAVARTIKKSRAGLNDPKRPIGSFLFIGPSGTGKTQLAKALATAVYKDENAMIRIDMSEYTDTHTVDRLIGAPPGYVGYEEGGQLTNKVLAKPYSLILLDEVEKANPKVFDIFLQVLDDGRLTDGQGKTVDFKNTIIIMTSNLADEENLNKFFRVEFLNRIDQVIHFKPLNVEIGKSIVQLFINDLKKRLEQKDIHIEVSQKVIDQIAQEGITDKYGARPLKRMVEEKIEDPIVEKIISGDIKPGETLTWDQI